MSLTLESVIPRNSMNSGNQESFMPVSEFIRSWIMAAFEELHQVCTSERDARLKLQSHCSTSVFDFWQAKLICCGRLRCSDFIETGLGTCSSKAV